MPSSTSSTERTLLTLFSPCSPTILSSIRTTLLETNFLVVQEAKFVGEELEEAGLDLVALGVGSGGAAGEEPEHTVLLLEKEGAVQALKVLAGEGSTGARQEQRNGFSTVYPELKLHCSPSTTAASMSINSLFSDVAGDMSFLSPPSAVNVGDLSIDATSTPPAKPFALSDLAFTTPNAVDLPQDTIDDDFEAVEEDGTIEAVEVVSEQDRDEVATNLSEPSEGAYQEEDVVYEGEVDVASTEDLVDDVEQLEAPPLARTTSTNSATSNPSFRARPMPRPSDVPVRLTKAAALRLGLDVPAPARRDPTLDLDRTPTAPVRVVPTPKSLAAPSIAPRGTKASLLRSNGPDAAASPTVAKAAHRQSMTTSERNALNRQNSSDSTSSTSTSQVASIAPPKVEPRLTRSAMLRAGMELPGSSHRRAYSLGGAGLQQLPTTPKMGRTNSLSSLEEEGEQTTPTATTAPRMMRAHTIDTARTPSASASAMRRELLAVTAPRVRLTKAAMLRQGLEIPDQSPAMRRQSSFGTTATGTSDETTNTTTTTSLFDGVPGHKRRETIQVASSARPKVEVRMSKAAMLRQGIVPDETSSPAMRRASTIPMDFEGIPGHKRRESITVASLSKPPSITPRLNRNALLRQQSSSSSTVPLASPTLARRPASSLGVPSSISATGSTSSNPRPGSALSSRSALSSINSAPKVVVVKKRIIAPRSNRAAELRAAKKEAEALATTAAMTGGKVVKRPGSAVGATRSSSALKERN